MRSILEELFYGNVSPNTNCRSQSQETKALMGYIADHHDKLLKELILIYFFYLMGWYKYNE